MVKHGVLNARVNVMFYDLLSGKEHTEKGIEFRIRNLIKLTEKKSCLEQ